MQSERLAVSVCRDLAMKILRMRRVAHFQNKIGSDHGVAAETRLSRRGLKQIAPECVISKTWWCGQIDQRRQKIEMTACDRTDRFWRWQCFGSVKHEWNGKLLVKSVSWSLGNVLLTRVMVARHREEWRFKFAFRFRDKIANAFVRIPKMTEHAHLLGRQTCA